ncbi:MAG: hypothetical protein ABL901_04165 [Hyphomicrobiaceae bacterium]
MSNSSEIPVYDHYDASALQPIINLAPADEQGCFMLLLFNIVRLYTFEHQFSAALALLSHVESIEGSLAGNACTTPRRSRLQPWREIAARDAILTLYHFSSSLVTVKSSATKFKGATWLEIDPLKLRESQKYFRNHFKDIEFLRHGIAHNADAAQTLEKVKRNSASGSFRWGSLVDRTFVVTNKNVHRQIILDTDKLRSLNEARRLAYLAFPAFLPLLPRCFLIQKNKQ